MDYHHDHANISSAIEMALSYRLCPPVFLSRSIHTCQTRLKASRIRLLDHVTIPRMTDTEFKNVNWSTESSIVEKRGGGTVYHNYTIINEHG